jgi:RNA recognition motif-containing protein
LFGKCGPLISALFDTNEFGQYLGTATVIYSRASSAQRAIKEYHLARIDNRPMKVDFAIKPAQPQRAQNVVNQNNRPANNQAQKQQNGMPAKRRNNNRIGKSGQGKTLNVRGANQRRRQRGGRVNQQ